MGFGSYVREKREAAGISMKDFCKQLEISMAYWSRIEREMEYAPKDVLVRKAAEILGLPFDRVFAEADRLPPDLRGKMPAVVAAYRVMQRRHEDEEEHQD
jgi:HTH-type transcriptional regulator, competence development regulator